MMPTGITRAEMVRRAVRDMPEGTEVTAAELYRALVVRYPKVGFTPSSIGAIMVRYCTDLVEIDRKKVFTYRRVKA